MRYKLGLKVKLLLIVATLLVLISSLFIGIVHYLIKTASFTIIKEHAIDITVHASKQLDGEMYNRFLQNPVESSPEYMQIRQELSKFRDSINAMYVYTIAKKDGKWVIMIDGWPLGAKQAAPVGDPMSQPPKSLGDIETTGYAITEIFYDQKWGNFFSVFSPIKHNGETIGYLGIDISAEKTENTIADMLNLSYQILVPSVFGVFVLAFIILVVFVNRIKKQLTSIKESMHHVAAGDLRVRSERVTSDELGDISDYNNQMIQEIYFLLEKIQTSYGILRKASRNVAAVSEETVAQSDELSKAVNEIAAGATKQAMELDDSVGKSKQLEDMLEKISADIYEFKKTAVHLRQAEEESNHTLQGLLQQGEENVDAFEQLQSAFRQLQEESNKIGKISSQVEQIAGQIRLLSLNASIEAARAGEYGKGFAVVANEVGKLAAQSSQSIYQIDQILHEFTERIDNMTICISDNMARIEEQKKKIEQTIASFEMVQCISEQIDQMAMLMEEKITQIDAIRSHFIKNLSYIAAVTEETTAAAEEAAASSVEQHKAMDQLTNIAKELTNITDDLHNVIHQFKLI